MATVSTSAFDKRGSSVIGGSLFCFRSAAYISPMATQAETLEFGDAFLAVHLCSFINQSPQQIDNERFVVVILAVGFVVDGLSVNL